MVICPSCNAQNEDGAGFCDQCGGRLGGGAAAYAPPPSYGAPAPVAAPGLGGGSRCPSCSAPIIAGEAFCDNCGAALGSAAPVAQAAPSYGPGPVYTPPAPSPAAPYTPVAPMAAATGRVVASGGQTFNLTGKTVYLIGREDAVSGVYPDIDTTATGGMEAGVGRRHAEIVVQGTQWFLKDLNSVNGTWVNNQRLAANMTQPINAGDQIRLGKWTATFQL
jgi:hypothetical protein